MNRYHPYPNYKPSGVAWLGDVPAHWEVKRLKNVIRAPITDGPHETPVFTDNGVPFLSVDGIQNGELVFEKCRYISHEAHQNYSQKAFVEIDDILLGKAASIGKVARVKVAIEFSIWSPLALIKPKLSEIKPSYLEYLLKSSLTQYQIQQLSTSNTQQNISMGDIPKFVFSLPDVREQTAIAEFLDTQTAKIDTLIAKQQQMTALLKEKRSAVISHAVTRGLNPDAPMKPSGVAWLGDVPAHWEVKRLKFNLELQTQKQTIDGQQVIALENIESKTGRFVETDSNYHGEDVAFEKGDILFGKLRPYLAKVFRAQKNGIAFGDLLTYRPKNQFCSGFGYYSLIADSFIAIVDGSTYGAKMPRASAEFISEMPLTTPPIEEQTTIAEFLDTQTAKIDTLIAKAEQAISLLQERRSALISAAVTGKIDVRKSV